MTITLVVTMKLECVFVLLVLLASADQFPSQPPADWYPITNIGSPFVTKVANFAITEHNKKSGSNLKLVKVIEGIHEFVVGFHFRLNLTATGGSTSHYEANVIGFQGGDLDPWRLISFIPE